MWPWKKGSYNRWSCVSVHTEVVTLPHDIHWACSRFKEVCGVFNHRNIAQNSSPDDLHRKGHFHKEGLCGIPKQRPICPFPEDTTWGFCSLSPWVTNGQWIWQKVTWASYLTILAPGKMAYSYMWVFVLDKIQMTSSLGFWMVLPLLSMSQLHPSPPHQPRTEK